jgi:hypothetical protein
VQVSATSVLDCINQCSVDSFCRAFNFNGNNNVCSMAFGYVVFVLEKTPDPAQAYGSIIGQFEYYCPQS